MKLAVVGTSHCQLLICETFATFLLLSTLFSCIYRCESKTMLAYISLRSQQLFISIWVQLYRSSQPGIWREKTVAPGVWQLGLHSAHLDNSRLYAELKLIPALRKEDMLNILYNCVLRVYSKGNCGLESALSIFLTSVSPWHSSYRALKLFQE